MLQALLTALSKSIQGWISSWVKAQFKGNPLVENTSEYLGQVTQALGVGAIAMFSIIVLAFIVYGGLVLSVLNGWL